MDYPCTKFDDATFSCFGFIMRTNTQHTESQTPLKRLTHATVVGMSNKAAGLVSIRAILTESKINVNMTCLGK